MIEPKNSQKNEFSKSCDTSASIGRNFITQDQLSTSTPLSIISEETIPDHFCEPTLSKAQISSQSHGYKDFPNENIYKDLSPENLSAKKIKELKHNAKGSCLNYIKTENQPVTRNQSTNSRSFSLDDCVEVQEYFQEEEISEDNNKGYYSSISPSQDEIQSQELLQGLKVLNEILSDSNKHLNWPFINPVEATHDGCQDYYERIKTPMWLSKMKEKFLDEEYIDITEFVSDMRLMIDNCLLFNGQDHSISKKAMKLETVLNQKVALLSRDLRDKINEAVPPRNPLVATDTLEQMQPKVIKRGKDSRRKMRELQKQRMLERKMMFDHFVSTLETWDENLFDHVTGPQMKAMWELPQLGLFLFLCSRPLNLSISQYELERCFIMSRQSSAMQRLMTSLFSSVNQRSKLHLSGSLMTTKVWEEKIKDHTSLWFKCLVDSNYDVTVVSEKFSIDEQFFKVMGYNNPLLTKSFHDLTYFQKIWIVKSTCDHLLNVQKSLFDAIERQDMVDMRPRDLGCDKDGNVYFYFSQFCGDDIRIYKQSPLPAVEIGPIEFTYDDDLNYYPKKRTKQQSKKRPRKIMALEMADDFDTPRARDSRLRQNPRQLKNYKVDRSDSSSELESDSEEEVDKISFQTKPSSMNVSLTERNLKRAEKESVNNLTTSRSAQGTPGPVDKLMSSSSEHVDGLVENDWNISAGNIPRRSERKIIEESIKNAVPESKSKTKADSESSEKLSKKRTSKNDWKALAPFLPERNLRSKKQTAADSTQVDEPINKVTRKSKMSKKNKKQKSEEEEKDEENENLPKVKDVSNVPSEAVSLDSSELTETKDDDISCKDEDKMEVDDDEDKMEVDDDEETCMNFEATVYGPNLEEFELVAESVQDIRDLITEMESQAENEADLNVSCQSKASNKKNFDKLLENLEHLLRDLEPHEVKLVQALKKARMQMRKEEESYREIPDIPDEDSMDGTEIQFKEETSQADDSRESKAIENLPQENTVEVKKKNIFENDIDMALLLTEGRVLRKRNNVQQQPQIPLAITRSKRLLNKPSRYKYDDYLTDESFMANACSDDVSKKSEDSQSALPSNTSISAQLAEVLSRQAFEDKRTENASVATYKNKISATEFITIPSTVTNSKANMAKVSTIHSAGLKSSTIQASNILASTAGLSANQFLVSLPQSATYISSLLARNIPDQITQSRESLRPIKAAMVSSPLLLQTQSYNNNTPSSNLSNLINQKSGVQLSYIPTSFNTGTPGLIILPKNVNLGHSPAVRTSALPQSFMPTTSIHNLSATAIGNKPIQLCPASSNVVINFQNVLSISNSGINIGNQIMRPPTNSFVEINSGLPSMKNTNPINISPMASRVLIPLKAHVSGNFTSLHPAQTSQSTPKVGNLISILNSAATNNINHLPAQVGQLNYENGQPILLLANNSFTQMPVKPQSKTTNSFQLQAQKPPIKNDGRSATISSETQGQKSTFNEAIVQQLVLNNLSNSNVAHQLIGPGLIPVTPGQANSSTLIRCATPQQAAPNKGLVNIPIILNKEMFRVLAQPQKPLQLNQVTSQGQ